MPIFHYEDIVILNIIWDFYYLLYLLHLLHFDADIDNLMGCYKFKHAQTKGELGHHADMAVSLYL